ncbi:hypothetical protein MMC10_006498 [Thelotrema lepadinum]|nr:hypothetical protein [Thelotrema lepadinum]
MELYLVFGKENVSALFGNSKHLARDNLTNQAFSHSNTKPKLDDPGRKGKKLPLADGTRSKRITEINDEEAAKIGRKLHDMQHLYLSQPSEIQVIIQNFVKVLCNEIDESLNASASAVSDVESDDETTLSKNPISLFKYLKRNMFVASTLALMGTRILELNPNLIDDYWAYDEAFLLGLSDLTYPVGNAARDKLLNAVQRYVEDFYKVTQKTKADDIVWDDQLGSKLFRASLLEMDKRGIAIEDQAGAILSLVWATASNSIPLTGWIVASLLEEPDLLSEVRHELLSAVDSTIPKTQNAVTFNMSLLNSLPLLNSIYHECLRVRASVTVTRRLTADIQIGGYTLRKGNFVMTPSYLAHTDPTTWNNNEGYEAHSFRAKRFLDTTKADGQPYGTSNGLFNRTKKENKGSRSSWIADALKQESFFPYGGGNAICPGRFFSKQQILVATAILILKMDIELVCYVAADGKTELANAPESDQRYAGGGVMPPEGDWVVKLKSRKNTHTEKS